MAYARGTAVSQERSEAEIKACLRRYGAEQFVSGEGEGRAVIGFKAHGRLVRFTLRLPAPDDPRFEPKRIICHRWNRELGRYVETGNNARERAYDAEIRRLWRALALVVKAKLEAVESGITTFESEFMAHIVMPDGKTVAEHVVPAIAQAYETGRVAGLLPEFTG
jgi:hypothetical protein